MEAGYFGALGSLSSGLEGAKLTGFLNPEYGAAGAKFPLMEW
jgi:hypothetical protein